VGILLFVPRGLTVQAEAALRLYLLLLLMLLCVGDIGKSDAKKCPPPAHTFVSEKCRGEFELGVARALVKTFHSLVLLTVYYLPLSFVIGKTETRSIPGTFALLSPQPLPFYHASSTQMAIHMLLFLLQSPSYINFTSSRDFSSYFQVNLIVSRKCHKYGNGIETYLNADQMYVTS
jgi:hypothetical protein